MKAGGEAGHRSPRATPCAYFYLASLSRFSPAWHTTTLTLRYSYAFTCNPRSRFFSLCSSSSLSPFSPFFSFPFALVFLPARLLSLISPGIANIVAGIYNASRRVPLSNVSLTRVRAAYHKRAGRAIFISANMIHPL